MPAVQTVITHLPFDWVIFGLFAAIAAIDAMRSGTQHAVAVALAAPLSLYLMSMLGATAFVGPHMLGLSPMIQAGITGALFLVLLVLIYRMLPAGLQTGAYPLQALLAGVAAAVIIATLLLQVPALSHAHISPLFALIFGNVYRAFWLFGAYLTFAFVSR